MVVVVSVIVGVYVRRWIKVCVRCLFWSVVLCLSVLGFMEWNVVLVICLGYWNLKFYCVVYLF